MSSGKQAFVIMALLCLCCVSATAGDIHDAAREGDAGQVKRLIWKNPALVREKDGTQDTPLHLASAAGHLDVVRLLVANDADIDAGDRERSTPLQVAAQKGQLKVVRFLVGKGAKVAAADDNGMTALHFAAYEGRTATARLLLDHGAAVNARTARGSTPLHGAAYGGHLAAAELLIARGADPSAENQYGWAPVMSAAYAGHLDMVAFLVSKGAAKERKHIQEALLRGGETMTPDMAALLLRSGARANEPNASGLTALHVAALDGSKDLVELLLAKGANLDADGWNGRTPLAAAALHGHQDVAALLLDRGASPDVRDGEGCVILHRVVAKADDAMAELLLAHGAKPNLRDGNYGRTALHWAALSGDRDLIDPLLKKGARIDAKDDRGKTPLFYAAKYGHPNVCRLLEARGAAPFGLTKSLDTSSLLTRTLADKEAALWYLGHCGWAVKTRNHLLVFDYVKDGKKPVYRSLTNGHLNPKEMAGSKVTVFVTHGHRDHFDPDIFALKETLPAATYVYGFQPETMPRKDSVDAAPQPYAGPEYVFVGPHETEVVDGMTVKTIRSNDAGVGFVVEVDGLTLYHAGDHAGWRDGAREGFVSEIDYLARQVKAIDMAFLNVTGCHAGDPEALFEGNLYTLKTLAPKVWFPTHAMDREYKYKEAADRFAGQDLVSAIAYPEHPGDCFIYERGAVRSCDPQDALVAALAPSANADP